MVSRPGRGTRVRLMMPMSSSDELGWLARPAEEAR